MTKRSNMLPLFLLLLFSLSIEVSAQDPKVFVYVARNTDTFQIYQMNMNSGVLTFISDVTTEGTAFTFTKNSENSRLYVGLRGGAKSGIMGFEINQTTGMLTHINTVEIPNGTVTVGLDKTGKFAFTVPYNVPVATVNRILDDGSLVDPATTFSTDQNPHQFIVSPDNKFAYIPCLGDDNVHVYQFDTVSGITNPNNPLKVSTANGAGPRFMDFHRTKNFAYVGLELNNTITAYSIDPTSGNLSEINTLSTLPATFTTGTTAQIHVTPNGKYVYISNRGHNSIAGFRIDQQTGAITNVDRELYGTRPRAFYIDPSSKFLFAGSWDNGEVVTYIIDDNTGELTKQTTIDAGDRITGILPVLVGDALPINKSIQKSEPIVNFEIFNNQMILSLIDNGSYNISVINLNGALLWQKNINSKGNYTFSPNLDPGMIFIKIRNLDKIIIQKIFFIQ